MAERIWLGQAPAGEWSSGPLVVSEELHEDIWENESIKSLTGRGWTWKGPYVLEEEK